MKRKLFLVFACLAFFVQALYAQDLITTAKSELVRAKITEVGTEYVKYKKYERPTGPDYSIAVADIIMIKYETGDKDIFEKNPQTGKIQIRHIAAEKTPQTPVQQTPVQQKSETADNSGVGPATAAPAAGSSAYPTPYQNPASNKWGFKDGNGNTVVPCKYDGAGKFEDAGLAQVGIDSKTGFIDRTGREIIPCIYESMIASSFSISSGDGLELIPIAFYEDIVSLKLNGKWGFVDKTGKNVTSFIYENISTFSEGFAAVKQNGKWGYINKTGNMTIPYTYENANHFSGGLAAVKQNGKWGYIDQTGNFVIINKYDEAKPFLKGSAKVRLNGREFNIDKNGDEM
jgi:hypothetical protein